MSDKNLDVDRAIASVGGEKWVYYSFKPVLTEGAKTGVSSSFSYNEFGEPEYKSPHLPLPAPSQYASPDDEYLEDAAYPEAHPGEVWDDVPAPEDHTARFIAPAPQPVSMKPSPFPFPSAPTAAAKADQAGGATPGLARPAYVPFLPSTLPQSSVNTSAQLYRPAERAAPAMPASPINAPAPVEPPSYVPTQISRPVVPPPLPVSSPIGTQAAAPPPRPVAPAPVAAPPPVSTARPTVYRPAVPSAAPPSLAPVVATPAPVAVAPAPAAPPAPLPMPFVVPAPVAPAIAERAAAPAVRSPASAPANPATTPYPQPFGTLADMYARLATHSSPSAEPPASSPTADSAEQKMFRRI